MSNATETLSLKKLRRLVQNDSVLIAAAGFEDRASTVLDTLAGNVPVRTILIRYTNDVPENAATFAKMNQTCINSNIVPAVVDFDPRRPDNLRSALMVALAQWPSSAASRVFVDVSGMPMQGIMIALAAVRESVPTPNVTVLYVEAASYFPDKATVMPSKRIRSTRSRIPPASALSEEMSGNLIPKYFAGSSISFATCLLLFAGYEKHRSLGVVDELNPAKVVLVFGAPDREDWSWRLEYSRQLHDPLRGSRPIAEETVSTLDPWASLTLLEIYYRYLFADHNLAVAPICSKMQTVGVYLFWEQYRDIQVVFPLPVRYLPKKYSAGTGRMFAFSLPRSMEISNVFANRHPSQADRV